MIRASKTEMRKLRERFPNIRATRTVHNYYVEERPEVVAFLRSGCKSDGGKHA